MIVGIMFTILLRRILSHMRMIDFRCKGHRNIFLSSFHEKHGTVTDVKHLVERANQFQNA